MEQEHGGALTGAAVMDLARAPAAVDGDEMTLVVRAHAKIILSGFGDAPRSGGENQCIAPLPDTDLACRL